MKTQYWNQPTQHENWIREQDKWWDEFTVKLHFCSATLAYNATRIAAPVCLRPCVNKILTSWTRVSIQESSFTLHSLSSSSRWSRFSAVMAVCWGNCRETQLNNTLRAGILGSSWSMWSLAAPTPTFLIQNFHFLFCIVKFVYFFHFLKNLKFKNELDMCLTY